MDAGLATVVDRSEVAKAASRRGEVASQDQAELRTAESGGNCKVPRLASNSHELNAVGTEVALAPTFVGIRAR